MMAQDLITLITTLQNDLQHGMLRHLRPEFEMVGSMAEGTRIGLANELDLGIKFKAWEMSDLAPFKAARDPFSLKKSANSFHWMDGYFNIDEFKFHEFMYELLTAVDLAIVNIFVESRNPPNLRRVTTNKDWTEGNTRCGGWCKRSLRANKFEQCSRCAVTVSQSKIGVALQFEWQWHGGQGIESIYCSVDLIPLFPIEAISVLELANLVNSHMLGANPPRGWLKYLFKYPKEFKIIYELIEARDGGTVNYVSLKTMNFQKGRNHYIKPAQGYTEYKFSSDRMMGLYTYIKFLKKVLNLDLSSYWVKKELLRDQYRTIIRANLDDDQGCQFNRHFRDIPKPVPNHVLSNTCTGWSKRIPACLNFPVLLLSMNLGQLMHGPSANVSLNVAGTFLLYPVAP